MGLALIVEKEKRVYGPWQTLIQAEFLILHYLRLFKRTIIMPNSTMLMTTLTLHGTQTHSKSTPPDNAFYDDDFAVDGEGYDSSDDTRNLVQPYNNNNSIHHPEVNLKNVLNGIFAIVTGRSKLPSFISNQQLLLPTSNVSFLGSAKNGDTFLNSSVYIPSAPPLLEPSGSSGVNYGIYKDVLEAEPPNWLPDSSTAACMQCTAPFTALVEDIIVGFVEDFSAEHVPRGGVCYLLI